MHYGPAGLSVYDLEEGWITAEAPIVAHVGNLDALSDLQVTGKELQPGFHMFIFGVDLRVDGSLTDSKDWRVDIETLDVSSVQSCKPMPGIEGACINQSMPPTCYVAADPKQGICSPNLKPNNGCAAGYTCYLLGPAPNCCNYCPPQWSSNC